MKPYKNKSRYYVLSLVLCFLPGCFTLVTQIGGEVPGPRVFSGTRAHVKAIGSGHLPWNETFSYWTPIFSPPAFGWHPLDLPFSLAADILILPYTIPKQLICGGFKEKEKEKEKENEENEEIREQLGEEEDT